MLAPGRPDAQTLHQAHPSQSCSSVPRCPGAARPARRRGRNFSHQTSTLATPYDISSSTMTVVTYMKLHFKISTCTTQLSDHSKQKLRRPGPFVSQPASRRPVRRDGQQAGNHTLAGSLTAVAELQPLLQWVACCLHRLGARDDDIVRFFVLLSR